MDYHAEDYRQQLKKEIELLDRKSLLLKVMNISLEKGEDVTEIENKIKALGI
ncbi:hypothetical protein [Priestia megaterium]|uniref:hypothetical protein n=1 Tax=Priestia megaterium TaxID=1404 RepID=UPI0028775051|nr:hypothetical protein [Priestia megaterium]